MRILNTTNNRDIDDLIPILQHSTGNTMLAQQVRGKIIRPLDPAISNLHAPRNPAIHTVVGVLG